MRLVVIIVFLLSNTIPISYALAAPTESKTAADVSKLQSDVKTITDKYDYVVKNFEIQNNTIMYVSAVLGSLLALVIFYFGWKAQKVETEYEKIKADRDKFREQYDKIVDEFNNKLIKLKSMEEEITEYKNEIFKDRDEIYKLVESFVLEYTESYISKNMENMIDNASQNSSGSITDALAQQLENVSSHLKILDSLQHESNPLLLYKKIDVLFAAKQYQEVEKVIDSIVDNDKFNKNYLFKYAYSLAENGKENEALLNYQKHLENKPNESAALNNLGNIFRNRNDCDKAIELYEKAIEIKNNLLYVNNLLKCYDNIEGKLNVYKKYWDAMAADSKFIQGYKSLIEDNFCISEIYEFHKYQFDLENNVSTYLNLLEASIISRNDSACDGLLNISEQYNFNATENVIFKLLKSINQGLRGVNATTDLNDIDIILDGSPTLEFTWNFNLLERIISKLDEGEFKEKTISLVTRIEEIKKTKTAKNDVTT